MLADGYTANFEDAVASRAACGLFGYEVREDLDFEMEWEDMKDPSDIEEEEEGEDDNATIEDDDGEDVTSKIFRNPNSDSEGEYSVT